MTREGVTRQRAGGPFDDPAPWTAEPRHKRSKWACKGGGNTSIIPERDTTAAQRRNDIRKKAAEIDEKAQNASIFERIWNPRTGRQLTSRRS